MATSPLEIKSRMTQGTPLKTTPVYSPLSRPDPRSPHKRSPQPASLSLRRIIGTTTSSPSGLASHYNSSRFAYCAGSAAVLATVDDNEEISYHFFRAHPNASPIHPYTSFYNATTPISTPEARRRTALPFRHGTDERPSNNSPRRTWGNEGSSKTWSARDRVKAVSCVDLSPNGRFLAVGETGYSPRVNIFSTLQGDPTDVPLTILTEHTFGVRCVAFSPNSRWLATLGDANDGFLFIWSINPKSGAARLHFTNKCTASVLDMTWCGNNLITVGTRYIKVWRIGESSSDIQAKQGRSTLESDGSSPAPKTLSGRNSLLGSLAGSTFTSVAPISDREAILCTKTGILCLLDDRTGMQELRYVRQLGDTTQSIAVDLQSQRIWFANCDGQPDGESFESLRDVGDTRLVTGPIADEVTRMTFNPSSPAIADPLCTLRSLPGPGSQKRKRREGIIASTSLPNRLVSIDDDRRIRIESLCQPGRLADSELPSGIALPAHNGAVQGVISLRRTKALGDFLTWSLRGAVNFWYLDGSVRRSENLELQQPEQSPPDHDEYGNELRVVRISDDAQWVVAGDRLGVLQVVQCQSWASRKARAHSAEITDIALEASTKSLLVATSSRDRTVQLLQQRDEELELLQTFNDHVGAVNAVTFVGDFLVSASSDRTVIVRQKLSRANDDGTTLLAYAPSRVITLKASPTSIAFPEPDVLAVSTMDRQILTFSIRSGVAVDSFKAFDADGEDAVILNALFISSMVDSTDARRILAGFSSTDKSIRLYDFDRGTLLTMQLGHTEGITDIAVVDHADDPTGQDRKTLISTGLDGLVMIWDALTAPSRLQSAPLRELSQGQARGVNDFDGTPIRDSILRRAPVRKVLSKLDLADMTGLSPPLPSIPDQFPPRLKKTTSRYSLAPRKLDGLSDAQLRLETVQREDNLVSELEGNRVESPSPTSDTPNSHTAIRRALLSPANTARGPTSAIHDQQPARRRLGERSPSPRPAPPSLPTTPKAINRANKGRLRRPPSIPSDIRGQLQVQTRRKSMGNVNEFGSIGMASEQICRTLRTYRKKIKAAPRAEQLRLDELEVELLATLRAVEERHDRNGSRRTKAATENDLDNLVSLMQTSGLGQWSESQRSCGGEMQCNGNHACKRGQQTNRSKA